MKTWIIDGVTGQDGSILADKLLARGERVIGLKRRSSTINTPRIDHLMNHPNFSLDYYDLGDSFATYHVLNQHKPDFWLHMAAQSHVRVSFEIPEETVNSIAMGTLRILDAIREISPTTRFYQAASSEQFGSNPEIPCNEDSKFCPESPYAAAKVFAFHMVRNYRKSYGLHASSGILFNHESELRGETFVTRKITIGLAAIKHGFANSIQLGNLDASRDWGYARDYMDGVIRIVEHDMPDDYVLASGETHTVREFLELAAIYAGINDIYKHVEILERLKRPSEVPLLLGDASKAKRILGWEPKTKFADLVKLMVQHDCALVGERKNGDKR